MTELRALIYFGRYEIDRDGNVFNARNGKQLKPGKQSRGYLTVSLYDGSSPKKPRSFCVHRLVADAFLGSSDLQINHKNGDKSDNRVENLEYCTAGHNIRHSVNVLGNNKGTRNGRAKLTPEIVEQIKQSTESNVSLGLRFGLSSQHIGQIKMGRYWSS